MPAGRTQAPFGLAARARVVAAVLGLGLAACQEGAKDIHEPSPVAVAATNAQTHTAVGQEQPPLAGTTTTETLVVDGLMREVLVYVPGGLPAGQPAPLILFLHGTPGTAASVAALGLSEEADRRGFIAVYPNGDRGAWNAWDGNPWSQADDVRFFAQLLDLLAGTYPIDATRTFIMGFSNGGGMSYRLACELSDRIAAIAVVAGPLLASPCAPGQPVSVLHIHGTNDRQVPYEGATYARATLPALAEMIAFWRTHNGCASEPMMSMVNAVVEQQAFGDCREGSEVTLYTIRNGSHCWPSPRSCAVGDPDRAFDATPVIVEFLLAHPRPSP